MLEVPGFNNAKNDIILAFFNHNAKRPINKISVAAMVKDAGYSRATFYKYFIDIFDVREQAEKALIMLMKRYLDEYLVEELGEGLSYIMNDFYIKYQLYLEVLLGPYGDAYFVEEFENVIKQQLLLQNSDQIKERNSRYIDLAIEYYAAGFVRVLLYYYKNSELIISHEEFINIVKSVKLNSIIPLFCYNKDGSGDSKAL